MTGLTEATRTWDSFDEFVHARSVALWRSAWLLTGDTQRAEDLVQEALCRCWGKFDRLNRAGNSFEAYVRTAIYHAYLSWWRAGTWREGTMPAGNPEPARHDSVADRDLLRALAALPRQQRAVVVLRYFEDRSTAEAADLLRISQGAVKTHLHRALSSLRSSHHLRTQDLSYLPKEDDRS